MTAQLADKLRPFGIDYVDAMDRFGDNAELYERLALKYLDDGHLVALQAAMEAKDYSEGYSQAHALKGVAGNLSFKDLYDCATLVSDALYAGEYDAAEKHLPEVERTHALVIEGLLGRLAQRHAVGAAQSPTNEAPRRKSSGGFFGSRPGTTAPRARTSRGGHRR